MITLLNSSLTQVPTWKESSEVAMALLLSSEKLTELKDFVLLGPAPIVRKGKAKEGEEPATVPELRFFRTEVNLISPPLRKDPTLTFLVFSIACL